MQEFNPALDKRRIEVVLRTGVCLFEVLLCTDTASPKGRVHEDDIEPRPHEVNERDTLGRVTREEALSDACTAGGIRCKLVQVFEYAHLCLVKEAVIVSTARTALAKSWKGAFNMTHGATLGSFAVKAAVERAGIDPPEVKPEFAPPPPSFVPPPEVNVNPPPTPRQIAAE